MNKIAVPTEDYKQFEKIGNRYYVRVFPKETNSGESIVAYEKSFTYMPSQEEVEAVEQECVNDVKERLLMAIKNYDTSEAVNAFIVNGITAWLDKATRVGLVNSANAAKAEGIDEITLWLGTHAFTVGCDTLAVMLNKLELYAMQCYNKTAEHLASVEEETGIDVLETYDYTAGYPEKLEFTLNTAQEA